MKKKIVLVLMAVCMVLGLCSCGSTPYNYKMEDYLTLGQYKGLTYSRAKIDEAVQSEIDSYLSGKATTNEVTDRAVKDGDTVKIDYTGYMDGETFEGGSATGADLEIGSDNFIDGFEDGLIGHKIGETVTLNLKFPDEYKNNPDFSGKDVTFEVVINSITEKIVPELTDELIAADGAYSNVADYKAAIEKQQIQNTLWELIYNATKVNKYPEKEIKSYYQTMLNNYKTTAYNYGIDFDTYATYYGFESADAFCQYMASYATSQAVQEMIIWNIARNEGITISKDEYNAFAEKSAENNGLDSVKELEKQYTKEYIEQNAYMEKVFEFIQSNATEEA